MALWLDLIPKLHRADGHDDGFDPVGAAAVDESPALADDLLAVVQRTSAAVLDDVKLVPTGAATSTYSARKLFLRSPAPTSLRSTVSVGVKPNRRTDDQPYLQSVIPPRTALAATLAIGCVALIVNCISTHRARTGAVW